jgi:hypothetical protein
MLHAHIEVRDALKWLSYTICVAIISTTITMGKAPEISITLFYRNYNVVVILLPVRLTRITNRSSESLEEAPLLIIQMGGENYRHLSIKISTLVWLSELRHTLPT